MSWTTSEATAFVAEMHNDLGAIGCAVGIYGSVARGELGNDLDLVVWPTDGRTGDPLAILDIFMRHGCDQHGAPYGGGPESYLQLRRGGQDVHVRVLSAGVSQGTDGPPWLRGPLRPLLDR